MQVYAQDVLSRLDKVKASITSLFGQAIKMDFAKKIVRKLAGEPRYTAAWVGDLLLDAQLIPTLSTLVSWPKSPATSFCGMTATCNDSGQLSPQKQGNKSHVPYRSRCDKLHHQSRDEDGEEVMLKQLTEA